MCKCNLRDSQALNKHQLKNVVYSHTQYKRCWRIKKHKSEVIFFFQPETQLTVLSAILGTTQDVTTPGTGLTQRFFSLPFNYMLTRSVFKYHYRCFLLLSCCYHYHYHITHQPHMPPTSPCEGCCVKMVQFIGTDHYQVNLLFILFIPVYRQR